MNDKLRRLINNFGLGSIIYYKGKKYKLEKEGLAQWVQVTAKKISLEIIIPLDDINLKYCKKC